MNLEGRETSEGFVESLHWRGSRSGCCSGDEMVGKISLFAGGTDRSVHIMRALTTEALIQQEIRQHIEHRLPRQKTAEIP